MWLLIWFFVVPVAIDGGAIKFYANGDTQTYKEPVLYYTNFDAINQESKERLWHNFRDYGVPTDVAQVYVPRGMTIGELFGKKNNKKNESNHVENDKVITSTFDPWSVVWYIGSFGGLIAFFLVVSCSEWCCLKNRAAQQAETRRAQTGVLSGVPRQALAAACTDTPPPAYHLFAPPPYDSITYGEKTEKYDVFVVPVHVSSNFIQATPAQRDAPPPEYSSVTMPPT